MTSCAIAVLSALAVVSALAGVEVSQFAPVVQHHLPLTLIWA
jgi:hypothetical protein